MIRWLCAVILAISLLSQGVPVAAAAPTAGPCYRFTVQSGALGMICIPSSGWNGDLVVYAHGYTNFNEPINFQNLTLPDGTSLPDLVQGLGFAFATTSYRQNGLAVLEGAEDIRQLVAAFRSAVAVPRHTYITGVSEGGLIAALLIERSPELFDGGLAACGPIGNFQRQLNYFGDFRVLFDAYFPGVLPSSAIAVPGEVIQNWESRYLPAVNSALAARPEAALELARVARAAVDSTYPLSVVSTTQNLLRYNIFATNDGITKLGGNPYGNLLRWYSGSSNDRLLNQRVQRVRADPIALFNVQRYQTTGRLTRPLVTLHTTGDEVIPYWHELLYQAKVQTSGQGALIPLTINRYGHCNFQAIEVVGAFVIMVARASNTTLPAQSLGISTTEAAQQVMRSTQP